MTEAAPSFKAEQDQVTQANELIDSHIQDTDLQVGNTNIYRRDFANGEAIRTDRKDGAAGVGFSERRQLTVTGEDGAHAHLKTYGETHLGANTAVVTEAGTHVAHVNEGGNVFVERTKANGETKTVRFTGARAQRAGRIINSLAMQRAERLIADSGDTLDQAA